MAKPMLTGKHWLLKCAGSQILLEALQTNRRRNQRFWLLLRVSCNVWSLGSKRKRVTTSVLLQVCLCLDSCHWSKDDTDHDRLCCPMSWPNASGTASNLPLDNDDDQEDHEQGTQDASNSNSSHHSTRELITGLCGQRPKNARRRTVNDMHTA